MPYKLQTLSYGQTSTRLRRRDALIVLAVLAAVAAGWGLWRLAKPYVDQQRYLAGEQRLHNFLLPPGTIVQTNDPAVIRELAERESIVRWHSDGYYSWDKATYCDRVVIPPKAAERLSTSRGGHATCLMRSPGGSERLVSLGTQTFYRPAWHPTPGFIVYFLTSVAARADGRPGNRPRAIHLGGDACDFVLLSPTDRLTIYAGVRSADQTLLTLPYRLNDQPGEFHLRLNNDGTVNITVDTGPANLVK